MTFKIPGEPVMVADKKGLLAERHAFLIQVEKLWIWAVMADLLVCVAHSAKPSRTL